MTQQFNYNRSAATAKRLIDKFGGEITIVVNTITPNTNAWKPGTLVPVETVTRGVLVNEEAIYKNETLIQEAGQKVLFYKSGLPLDPDVSGFINIESVKWKFEKLKTVAPGGIIVIYTARVTR